MPSLQYLIKETFVQGAKSFIRFNNGISLACGDNDEIRPGCAFI